MKRGLFGRVVLAACGAVMVSCAGRTGEGVGHAPAVMPAPASAPDAPDTVGKPKLWTGSVRFVGFSERQLDEFRVVPEQTKTVYRPMNALYRGVDGFWWKHESQKWFKIPGHCEVVVWPPGYEGDTPRADGTDEEVLVGSDRPQTWSKCKPWLTQTLLWNGRPHKAGWYPNVGKTGVGAGYPW